MAVDRGSAARQSVVAAEDAGERLDRVLAARVRRAVALAPQGADPGGPRRDRRRARSAIRATASTPATPSRRSCRRRRTPSRKPESIPLNVVYEDDDIIVIDKPHGLVVHPAAGNWTGTLVNALIAHCGDSLSGIGGVRRPGIVHRLDKDTTGLMVVAKTDRAHNALAAQFADHGRTGPLRARLPGLRLGRARPPQGHDRHADRPPSARARQDGGARRAAARRSPTGRCWSATPAADGTPVASLLACRLETGRTHQIRVHLAAIGHPLLGDDDLWAGLQDQGQPRSAPEAASRAGGPWKTGPACLFTGRSNIRSRGENLEFRSELPDDLARLRHSLGAAWDTRSTAKAAANQWLGRTRRRHGDVTPSCLPFARTYPVCCICDRASRSQHGRAPSARGAAVFSARRVIRGQT